MDSAKDPSEFLQQSVEATLSVLVSGERPELVRECLRQLREWIPAEERVVTVQAGGPELAGEPRGTGFTSGAECVMRLDAPAGSRSGVTAAQLVAYAPRMRAERVVLADCEGAAAFAFLDALRAGLAGSLAAVGAASVGDALQALETRIARSHPLLAPHETRGSLAELLDLIVHVGGPEGEPEVTVAAVRGMDGADLILDLVTAPTAEAARALARRRGKLPPDGVPQLDAWTAPRAQRSSGWLAQLDAAAPGWRGAAFDLRDAELGSAEEKLQMRLLERLPGDPAFAGEVLGARPGDWRAAARARVLADQMLQKLMRMHESFLPVVRQKHVIEAVCDELLGAGPLQPLLLDPAVEEVLVNGPWHIYARREGRRRLTDLRFRDVAHLRRLTERLVSALEPPDPALPYYVREATVPGGMRLTVMLEPVSRAGPLMLFWRP